MCVVSDTVFARPLIATLKLHNMYKDNAESHSKQVLWEIGKVASVTRVLRLKSGSTAVSHPVSTTATPPTIPGTLFIIPALDRLHLRAFLR